MWRLAAILKCCIIMLCHELVQCTCFKLRYWIVPRTHFCPFPNQSQGIHFVSSICPIFLYHILLNLITLRISGEMHSYISPLFPNFFRLSYVETVSVLRAIWGWRQRLDENCALLGCYVASIGNSLETFRHRLPGNVATELESSWNVMAYIYIDMTQVYLTVW